jgi:hypothetical protein
MDKDLVRDTAFRTDDDLYNKKIKAVPTPEKQIGIDLSDSMLNHIVDGVQNSQIDMTVLDSFTQVSRSRNEIYETLDYMAEDSTISAILETYAEDATETNDQGNIVWAESADAEAGKFVTYLLNALNVDKNIYKWAHSLCKYGDVYLRLYRESEYNGDLFSAKDKRKAKSKKDLNEDVKIKYYAPTDKYVHYLEYVDNPAQAFELTRFGKTYAYIKTDVVATNIQNNNQMVASSPFINRYSFNVGDVEVYQPTEFVHACLEDNSSRLPEEVDLFLGEDDAKKLTFKVKRGQSLLYNSYKIWRQLMLLENSVLLNRVTQSSIVRVVGVEVGDMPKENVQLHLSQIKQMIEQKTALNIGNSMSEYTNPGPIVNNIYVPTRNNQGLITTQQIGGDVKIGDLDDLGYYQDKFFGSMRVPKQYFGVTDDNAGFSGGESLSLISSRYAKMIKRIQNTLVQMITDVINLICIDTGNDSYINKFTIKMQAPTTKEENDRRENIVNKVSLVSDIMNTLTDVESIPTKLKILKALLSDVISDQEVVSLLSEEIEALEKAEEDANAETEDTSMEGGEDSESYDTSGGDYSFDEPLDLGGGDDLGDDTGGEEMDAGGDEVDTSSDEELPSPSDLDVGDMSDMTNPNL